MTDQLHKDIQEIKESNLRNEKNLLAHEKLDEKSIAGINKKLDEVEEERRKRHEEVMEMLRKQNGKLDPLYDKFIFDGKMSSEQQANLGKWIKYAELFLKISAVIGILWVIFKYGVLKALAKL